MEETRPNPNGANGTTSDPREQVMWDIYVEGLLNGYENAYEAAIKAGYEESNAKNITLRGWFKERKDKLRRKDMYSDAEKLLHRAIKYDHLDKEGNVRVDLLRVQTQVATTLATTLGKDDGYSTRQEQTGKGGEQLQSNVLLVKFIKDEDSNN
jgi:hypothetical protein